MKSLDQKLASIHANPHGAKDFILADAKDADMAAGLAAPGKDARTGKIRSLAERKSALSRSVIKADSAIAKSLTKDDLEFLFADPS